MATNPLKPLTPGTPDPQLLGKMHEIIELILPLHDLLKTPVSETEQGLITQLFDLMTSVRDELEAYRHAVLQTSDTERELRAEITDLRRQVSEIHALLITPIES